MMTYQLIDKSNRTTYTTELIVWQTNKLSDYKSFE